MRHCCMNVFVYNGKMSKFSFYFRKYLKKNKSSLKFLQEKVTLMRAFYVYIHFKKYFSSLQFLEMGAKQVN